MYKIYSIKNYKLNVGPDHPILPEIKPTLETDDIKLISDALKKDNGYHIKLIDNDFKYKLYFDLDHIPNNEYIHSIIIELAFMLNIEEEDIKYTESIKSENEYSYHIVIPNFKGDKYTQKCFVEHIIKDDNFKFYKFNDSHEVETIILNKYFDLKVYDNNNAFRLPNQTVDSGVMLKPFKHNIIRGDYEDFILNYFKTEPTELKTTTQEKKKKSKKPKVEKKPITFISDEQLESLLNKLDPSYVDDYSKWSIITNIFKGIDKYKLWDDWSKGSDRYCRFKNLNIWKNTKKIKFNVNFLINIVGATDIYKEYKPLTVRSPDIIYNNKYVSNKSKPELEPTEFDKINIFDYKTIIIKSTTGTGKTTAVANSIGNNQIISIFSRITLGDQIKASFDKCGIHTKDYRTEKYKKGDNYNVCLNSLLKLDIEEDELNETIIYIDEINSFVKHMMMLDGVNIKGIFIHLLYIIKHCKLLILSDAVISDSVFELIKNRDDNIYFLENTFKKFKDVEAIRVLDEELFKNKIEDRIKNNKYGLNAFDSKEIATQFHDDFMSKYPDKIENFLLITADHPFSITNASKQFKNKFVFFSPSITTAVDFSIDTPQDVFVYIKGNTIDPSESFQQATRTRNINQLFYYINKINGEEQYNDLQNCSEQFLSFSKTAELLNTVSSYIDENDELVMANSTFFKLFIYIQYVNDTYNTNKLKHFQLILEHNEFILRDEGEKKKLDKTDLSEASKEIKIEELHNYLLDPTNPKYEIIDKRVKVLNIPVERDLIDKYSEYILSPFKLDDYLNTIRFFKDEKYIIKKIELIKNNNYSVKWMSSVYNKILIFRQFEKVNKLDFNYDTTNEEPHQLEKSQLELYKKIFKFKFDAKTKGDLFKIYLSMIKHIAGADIIKTERKQINKVKKYYYSFNTEYINKLFELNKYLNADKLGFDKQYHKLLDITTKPEREYINNTGDLDKFIDE